MTSSNGGSLVPTFHFQHRWVATLTIAFVLSLSVRIPGIFTLGMGLNGPGTFQPINFDEGNSCKAALGWKPYPAFVGQQILFVASRLGHPAPLGLATTWEAADRLQHESPSKFDVGDTQAVNYCQSRELTLIQRVYSAVAGALSVVLVGMLGLMMWPQRPQIAWTACALLGLSSFHIGESHFATIDAVQVFYILLLTVVLAYGVVSGKRWPIIISPVFLAAALLAKWYVFAVFAYACIVPHLRLKERWWKGLGIVVILIAAVLIAPHWREVAHTVWERRYLVWGDETGPFGTDYGHIGTWRRWIRNTTNLPIVLIMGLGLPAFVFVCQGLRRLLATREAAVLWLAQAPALVYALYMLVLGPATYYRYYLPLLPTAALLAAYGVWESRWAQKRLFLVFFFVYPLLLTVDSEYNYFNDPRLALRPWDQVHHQPRLLFSYYAVPPRLGAGTAVFKMGTYLSWGAPYLQRADYVILSENWYDTAFPNELNGPIAWNPEWLIKTTPEYALAYRKILAGTAPNLELETEFTLHHFTPEFIVHRYFYGTFQQFIGDVKVFRVKHR